MKNFSFWKFRKLNKPFFTIALFGMVLLLSACGGVRQAGSWPAISATNSHVYVAFSSNVVSLDVENEQEVWRFQGEGAVEFYAPPLIVPEDGTVYLADFGRSGSLLSGGGLIVSMYALEDGTANPPQTRWIKEDVTDGRIVAGLHLDDNVIFTGSSNNRIVAVSKSTGDAIWEASTENAVWSAPSKLGETVFVSSLDRNIYALDASDGSEKWTHTLNGAGSGSAVVSNDGKRVYVGSLGGEVIALDVNDGSDIWSAKATEIPTGYELIWGAPVEIENAVVFADLAGNVFAVDAQSGNTMWESSVTGSVIGDVVVSGSTILIASGIDETQEGYLTAFSVDGEQLWETKTTASINTSPAVMGEGGQVAVVYGSIEDDIPLGVDIVDVNDGSITWTWTLVEE